MRLVDADAVMEDICSSIEAMTAVGITVDAEYLWGKLNDVLDNAPTVDAVPVVRCKECAHWCICHHGDNWFCADGTPINTASDYYDDKGYLLRNLSTCNSIYGKRGEYETD